MLCTAFSGRLPASYAVEPKLDGIRVLIYANPLRKTVSFKTRNGRAMPSLDHLKAEVLAFIGQSLKGDVILDAEATCGGLSFFDSVGPLRGANKPALGAILTVFDFIHVFHNCQKRREVLEAGVVNQPSVRLIARKSGNPDVEAEFKSALEAGFEGIIIKDLASDYQTGERSEAWQKMKQEETHDCKVIAVTECTTQKGRIGSLTVDFNGVEVAVGSGFRSDIQRRNLWEARKSLVGSLVEVGCHMVTPNGSMRHPRLVKVRADK
jgi:DNA ligase-1